MNRPLSMSCGDAFGRSRTRKRLNDAANCSTSIRCFWVEQSLQRCVSGSVPLAPLQRLRFLTASFTSRLDRLADTLEFKTLSIFPFSEPFQQLLTTALILKNLIKALGKKGKAVFYCSHVLEVVEQVCSHLLILRKGSVLAYDKTEVIQSGIEHFSLEKTFMHLVDEIDVDKITRDIVIAMEEA